MLEILKTLILDFQELPLETGLPRRLATEVVSGKATVYLGVRRSGKSTYLFQNIQGLLDSGVPRENILFLNFFDDRLHPLDGEGLHLITEAYFSIYPEKKNKEKIYCFFDEIQEVEDWEPFVDRLMRTETCEVYLTGSSARMLSREVATQMRGRALAWEIFPFSFREFLDYKRIESPPSLSTKNRLLIQKAFDEFWEVGGFPEVLPLPRHLRIKIHQEYLHAVLFRDLIERHNIAHPKALTDLTHRLIENAGSLYSINSLTSYLRSIGHKAPKATVGDYLEWFEDAFFLFSVPVFDASISRRKVNPRKIYCIDHALIRSVSSQVLANRGHLLENLVFTALRRVTPDLYYYKTQRGGKVDFLAQCPDRSRKLVQTCESMRDPDTRKREIGALEDAMQELSLQEGTIVTRTEEEEIEGPKGQIHVVPAWRFLLAMSL